MITLIRAIRLWQLKTKWSLAIWQLIDKQAMELIKNPEELEEKLLNSLAKLIHEANMNKSETQNVSFKGEKDWEVVLNA